MPLSRYPRVGHALAPKMLSEILAVPLPRQRASALEPGQPFRLCDLDETAWSWFDFKTCHHLSRAIIRQVSRRLPSLPSDVATRSLPQPSSALQFDALELEVRTYNSLRHLKDMGFLATREQWHQITIAALLEIPGFGAKSLVDFLTAFEAIASQSDGKLQCQTRQSAIASEPDVLRDWCERPRFPVPVNILGMHVPSPPEGMTLERLRLDTRTYNCLEREGLRDSLGKLKTYTIQQLLEIQGFGELCLQRLLTAILTSTGASPTSEGKDALRQWLHEPVFPPPKSVLLHRLPALPEGTTAHELRLEARTYNCLKKQGLHERLRDLEQYTVDQLLQIRGFGQKCLLDLLTAIHRLESPLPSLGGTTQGKEPNPDRTPQATTLEGELSDQIEHFCRRRRNRDVILRYFGLDGQGGATLREVGQEFGVTRERVRQICTRTIGLLKGHILSTPLLDRALTMVASNLPQSATDIEAALVAHGLVKDKFRLEGLVHAASLFGRKVGFCVELEEGVRVALPAKKLRLTKTIARAARRSASKWGAATIPDIMGQIEENAPRDLDQRFVRQVVTNMKGFAWLDEPAGWFWLRSLSKNRLLSRMRKILAVAQEIEVAELRAGIARHYHMKGFAPPKRVLLELCRQLPGCRVNGTVIIADPPIDWRPLLRETERTMVTVLKEHGPIMQRAMFEELCLARGMKRSTFYVYLDYSPVIERFGYGVCGIRGAQAAPGLIEALIPKHRLTTVRVDHGWTGQGRVWIGYRVSRAMAANGVFSVPPGFKKHLHGDFSLRAADGSGLGTLVIDGSTGWGIGPFFRRRGGEPGDVLVILFDLSTRVASVEIGDEDLLDKFHDDQAKNDPDL